MMSSYRKALKNYTTKDAINNLLNKIQSILLDFGAKGIGYEYEDGKVSSIHFKIELEGNDRLIKVPLRSNETRQVLEEQGVLKKNDDYHSYRVSLANVKDWLDAQLAIEATKMVKFEEIFLPYFVNHDGRTFFEVVQSNNYLLPEPNEN